LLIQSLSAKVTVMKIKLQLTDQINDLNGKPVAESTAAEILAESLMNGNEGPPLALLRISKSLVETKEAEVTPIAV
jgi:hypothetical protein